MNVPLRSNECMTAATAELRRAGITPSFARGSKHWQVQWQSRTGEPRMMTIPGTPSDFRSARNIKADIRRMLREDGMLPEDETSLVPAPERELSAMGKLEQRLVKLAQLQEKFNKEWAEKFGGLQEKFEDLVPPMLDLQSQLEGRIVKLEHRAAPKSKSSSRRTSTGKRVTVKRGRRKVRRGKRRAA